jgi:hypothetical protein
MAYGIISNTDGGATSTDLVLSGNSVNITGATGDFVQDLLCSQNAKPRIAHPAFDQGVTTNGNESVSLYPDADTRTQVWDTTLTNNRNVTLDTTDAYEGQTFKIIRTAAGAFNLNVGTGPLKALAADEWCEVIYDGSEWSLSQYGVLGALGGETNVKTFGATGDGVTDDYAEVQAAIDAAPSGGTVLFPNGTYLLGTLVDLDNDVRLVGQGRGSVIKIDGQDRLRAGSNDVHFENLTFSSDATTNQLLHRTASANYTGWSWRNCFFENVALRLTKNGRVDNGGSAATEYTGVWKDCQVLDCEFTGYTLNYTLNVGGGENILIANNYIHDCGTDTSDGDAIKVAEASTKINIHGNIIVNPKRDGIDLYNGTTDSVVDGNIIDGAGLNAIEAKWADTDTGGHSERLVISNNVATGCGKGFIVNVNRSTITGNVCENSGDFGFVLNVGGSTATSETSLIGNVARGCTSHGFSHTNGTRIRLIGNVADSNGGDGIVLGSSASGYYFAGNNTYNNSGTDFNLAGTSADNNQIIEGVTFSRADVSNPPTDAELDAEFGTPATLDEGFTAFIDDNGAGTNFYQVVSDGTNWWYSALTKAT